MPLAFTTGTSSHPKNTLQKRRFEIKILLLLHVLIPGVMLSSLETINPWLSACDLKQQSSSDLKGTCSAEYFLARTTPLPDVELLCPKECPPNESKTNASCLAYLDDARKSAICNFNLGNGIEWLKSFLGTIRLRHCCEYKIIESLSQSLLERVLRGKEECFRIIDSLVDVDNLAARVTCEFSEILSRYDCGQPYSIRFSCRDCLEAYRRWVCSTLVPYFNESTRIRPCRSVCQAVEQKCPYFLPENKAPALPTQYAGEPTFLCMDPNIPETGLQQKKSLYPDKKTCCVKICGSLKDGLCIDKASNCKSEELMSYEEALDQAVECVGSDFFGSRVPSLECTATEPYSSPHKLGSGARKCHPGPALVLYAYLNLQARRVHYLIILLAFHYCFSAFSLIKIFACLLMAFMDFSWMNTLLWNRLKNETNFFNLIKYSKLIFNYFKFNSNKWQYYFILISVNLLFHLVLKSPEPLTILPYLPNGIAFGKGGKTRSARLYYYYDYYYCYHYTYYYHKHSYTILRRIAQNWIEFTLNSRKSCDSTRIPLKLVITNVDEVICIRITKKNEDSLTIIILKTNRNILIIIILPKNDYAMRRDSLEIAEATNGSVVSCRSRTKLNPENATSAILMIYETSSRVFAFKKRCRPYEKLLINQIRDFGIDTSEQKIILILVKLCCLHKLQCSDPKCEFQTFLKLS